MKSALGFYQLSHAGPISKERNHIDSFTNTILTVWIIAGLLKMKLIACSKTRRMSTHMFLLTPHTAMASLRNVFHWIMTTYDTSNSTFIAPNLCVTADSNLQIKHNSIFWSTDVGRVTHFISSTMCVECLMHLCCQKYCWHRYNPQRLDYNNLVKKQCIPSMVTTVGVPGLNSAVLMSSSSM